MQKPLWATQHNALSEMELCDVRHGDSLYCCVYYDKLISNFRLAPKASLKLTHAIKRPSEPIHLLLSHNALG